MTDVALGVRRAALGVRVLAVVLGALLVAGAAQVSVPLPGTPVPMTLQPMAVLLVAGLLGPQLGALSMILYLAMGAAGLPVFTPTVPLIGVARLFGPTGGYLLAYPVAAWVVGRFSDPGWQPGVNKPAWARVTVAVVAGLVLIHLGGLAELVPGWGGPSWFVARTGSYEVIGFGLATWIVGRLLNKYSWDRMGWHRTAWPQLGRGVLLGALMAALAICLAVLLDGARVRMTGDWNVWARVALPLIIGLIFAALGEELGFRGYPLRRLGDTLGILPAMLVLAILFG